MADSFAMPL